MLFVTNRYPKQSIRSREGRNWEFDLDNNASSNSIFFCERTSKNKYMEIMSEEFLYRLKASAYKQILVYIHGFANLPEDAFSSAAEFQRYCDKKKKNEILVVPIIWPNDNDVGIIKDYWDDQKAADQSAFSFARALGKFLEWRNDDKT